MAAVIRGVFILLLVALYIVKRRRSRHPNNVRFPPGPKGFPLLGVALSIDASKPWFTYYEWRKLFGRWYVQQSQLASLIHSRRPRLYTYLQYGCTHYKLCQSSA